MVINVKKVVTSSVFLLAFLLLILSLLAIVAEIYSFPAKGINDKSSIQEIDFALGYLEKAKNIQDNNGYWRELEGELLLYKSRLSAAKDKVGILNQAVSAFHKSISEQPESARLWGDLALTKATLEEFDDEFYKAYQKADEYGGWEFQTNILLTEVGFASWYSTQGKSKLRTKKSIMRVYSISPDTALGLADKYGQLYMVCLWAMNVIPQDPVCKRVLNNN